MMNWAAFCAGMTFFQMFMLCFRIGMPWADRAKH